MDYTSFAPGASAKPKVPVKLTPQLPPQNPKHIHHFASKIILLILIGVGSVGGLWWWNQVQLADDAQNLPMYTPRMSAAPSASLYRNDQYGFSINLPSYWGSYSTANNHSYSILNTQWQGTDVASGKITETGPLITLRSPNWLAAVPTEDMPIMVFTPAQWQKIQQEQLAVSAAPIPPSLLGQNSKYVFALPARYNYDYKTGWQDVDQAVHTLKAFEPTSAAAFCGGIAAVKCSSGYMCKVDGTYPDAGGTCVAIIGMHCGGNIKNAPTCPSGYMCKLNMSNPDTGGTCVKQ
jgi:hypothetical protein